MYLQTKAFTLIELLVVIAIIGILSSVVLASLSGARESARNSQRRQTLNQIQTALEMYYNDNDEYPTTGSFTFTESGGDDEVVYGDPTCTFNGNDVVANEWVPGLVTEGYMSSLPQDPLGEDQARNYDDGACYMYSSDGDDYLLTAWATVEGGLVDTNDSLYSRAGFRETNHNIDNAHYYCNHSNIGGSPDHYRHSYTITTLDCSW